MKTNDGIGRQAKKERLSYEEYKEAAETRFAAADQLVQELQDHAISSSKEIQKLQAQLDKASKQIAQLSDRLETRMQPSQYQLKEEIYQDLTGLLIRAVTKEVNDTTFDCIQSGRNGSMSPSFLFQN
jgi:TolA-binding protein